MRSRLTVLIPFVVVLGCQDKKTDPPVATGKGTPDALTSSTAGGDASGPAKGAIMGKPFTPDNVVLEGRRFSFRKGTDFFADMEIAFDLPEPDAKKPAADEWKFGQKFGDPTVQVAAREGKDLPKVEFVWGEDYTATLRFTKRTSKSVEGMIDLKVTKPANTHLAGTFTATVKKTPTDPLDADDAPYIQGAVKFVGPWKTEKLAVGFVGKSADGKKQPSNLIGADVTSDRPTSMTNTSYKPQETSLTNDPKAGPMFRHTKVPAGEYWVFAKRGDVMAAWKKVTVKEGDQLTVDLTIDPSKTGELEVTLPDAEVAEKDNWHLSLVPAEMGPELGWEYAFNAAEVKSGQKTVTVKGVPAGKYRVIRGQSQADAEVTAGKTTKVNLVRVAPKK